MNTMTKLQISRHTTSNFVRIIFFLFLWQRLGLTEHPYISKKIIEKSWDKQGTEITPHYIPSKNAFEHQQEEHLDQETGNRRKIEQGETHPESAASSVHDSTLPYPEIGPQVIAHHSKLKRNDGRKDVTTPIRGEDIVWTKPKHECINTRAKQTA